MKLTDPIFSDADRARAHFEAIRWPSGPVCPHCREAEKVYRVTGKSARPGLIHCNACEGQFTVTTGGVMESSKIPLNKWALGFYLYAASKKGFSAHQLHRQLGITYKSAWFMAHRIREAMAPADDSEPPLGGSGQIVEADETELAPSRKTRTVGKRSRAKHKRFVALVERDGKVRSKIITEKGMHEVRKAVRDNLAPGSVLHTDGAQAYKGIMPVGQHEAVDHDKMYTRDSNNGRVHVNTAEGYFSLFKRGLVGTYQHVGSQHLPRYLAEFDFRMSNRAKLGVNDTMRAELAIKGADGKRLTYRQSH
jgi:transposase-like protein